MISVSYLKQIEMMVESSIPKNNIYFLKYININDLLKSKFKNILEKF